MTNKRRPISKNSAGGNDTKNSNSKYRLHDDEVEIISEYRRIFNEAKDAGLNPKDVKHGWIKSKEASLFFKNPGFDSGMISRDAVLESLIKDLQEYSPKFKPIKRTKSKDAHLLVIDPADIHLGKLASSFETGEDYNNQIAVKRVLEGVHGILDKASGFNIDKFNFIGGNDILHIDTPRRTTTSGTFQDTDGMWYDNFLIAKKLYVDVLEILIAIADVHFTFNPSNHDYTNGFFLADVIKTHFRNCKNITFDCSPSHRKYYAYGTNLIGTTHGDGAKQLDLGALMSVEAKEYWSTSEHRYFYTHHIHHKISKEYINVSVESLRSPSGADSWHHRNGYQHASKAVEGFIHSKKHGQIARLTHIF